jgi:hypothetical protein
MRKPHPPTIVRFPAAKQRRLDELLDKNSAGTMTDRERAKLKQLVAEAEALMVANARKLAAFAQSEASRVSTPAVPVTVWVQPEAGKP